MCVRACCVLVCACRRSWRRRQKRQHAYPHPLPWRRTQMLAPTGFYMTCGNLKRSPAVHARRSIVGVIGGACSRARLTYGHAPAPADGSLSILRGMGEGGTLCTPACGYCARAPETRTGDTQALPRNYALVSLSIAPFRNTHHQGGDCGSCPCVLSWLPLPSIASARAK